MWFGILLWSGNGARNGSLSTLRPRLKSGCACLGQEKNLRRHSGNLLFKVVAALGLEPRSRAYETLELPLFYAAAIDLIIISLDFISQTGDEALQRKEGNRKL
jgi:hypothetical protein